MFVKDVVAVVNVAVVADDDGAARSLVGRIVEMAFSLSKDSFLMEQTLLFLLSLASAKSVSRGGDLAISSPISSTAVIDMAVVVVDDL